MGWWDSRKTGRPPFGPFRLGSVRLGQVGLGWARLGWVGLGYYVYAAVVVASNDL